MRQKKPNSIPGINQKANTDLAVLRPFRLNTQVPGADSLQFSHWLSSRSGVIVPVVVVLAILLPGISLAQSSYTYSDALAAFWKWLPLLVGQGFVLNILISFFTMLIGTILGIFLGLGQLSVNKTLRIFCISMTQLFRNSPWLVLLFIVMLSFPFEIDLGFTVLPVPDWMKAVFGLSLPIMANISEIVRGAVISVPSGQWEASESLGFTRRQTMWEIILPQCFKRMIPPWMNWYAILTMATPLVSLLGVEEIITLSRQAMEAEDNHPELLIPFFGFALLIFFIYCYPIAKATVALEKRFAVKL